jgi:ATP-dependent DNA helicase RecG
MSSKSVASLPGIGPAYQNHLERINILTLTDLLQHFPSRFLDFSITTPIHLLKLKQSSSFKATIDSPTSFYSNSGKYITTATATDKTGNINLVWFNSRFISSLIKPNSTYTIAGTPTFYSKKLAIFSPQIELFTGKESLNTQGFVPIYPLTKGISSKWLRAKVKLLLNQTSVKETLSKATLQKLNLPNINQALSHIHFPPSLKHQDQADKRLAFNQHLKICQKNLREQKKRPPATKITINQPTHLSGLKKLPFKLTKDQTKALKDCYKDINSTTSSRRLIHGDTGSGKTAGLILLANQCLHSQFSFVLLAPTQILAKQHEATFKKMSLFPKDIKLITGNTQPSFPNKPCIYIGTHALLKQLPQTLKYPAAILAIDEQHKFGVKQRQALLKRDPSPHIINLSATPIPRTVALGLFGELNLSTIKEKPSNRLPIKTWVMDKKRLKNGQKWLSTQLKKGNKAFVVCPNIESKTAASIKDTLPKYKKDFGKDYPIWSLHGKTPPDKRDQILKEFDAAKAGILITTPLIEVGIDIPKANIIIIHSADRFGLAQLHQLRGRVGRGQQQAYCLVIPSHTEQTTIDRLQLLAKHSSGLKLAKLDLKLRGAGELFGKKQHGRLPVRLKYFWNKQLFQQAKKLAVSSH